MEPPLPLESQEKLLYLTSIYTQEDSSLPSPGSAADLRRQPVYTVESLQLKAKQSSLARGLDKVPRRHERLLGGVEEEAEEEEEEEGMDTQPAPLQEPFLPENAVDLAEKRAALQGSVWQVSSGKAALMWGGGKKVKFYSCSCSQYLFIDSLSKESSS